MNLELTKQEGQALIQLLDIAVKAQGLQVAEAGVVLAKRIAEAQKAEDDKPVEPAA